MLPLEDLMTNPTATIETSLGTITLELWPDQAPKHVENFTTLARDGFYNGLLFHRVIPGFMVQTGCPQGTGTGGPGHRLKAEFNDSPFLKGTLGMARTSDPDSAGSQFFICVDDARHLDRQYTAFGKVVGGQEIADQISQVPRDQSDRPQQEVTMVSVSVPETPPA
jgi:peptidyl-prolyl cis-trans isomerase B (cyclophilin B)